MIVLTFFYFAICILAPTLLTRYTGDYDDKTTGVATLSHIIYAIFAVISMVAEIWIYKFAVKKVKHLLPTLIDVEYLDKDDTSWYGQIKLFFKGHYSLLEWISYILSLVLSQVDRFDLYSDVCFIVICFKSDFIILGLISFAVLSSHVFSNIVKLFSLVSTALTKGSKRLLNTHEIN